MTRFKAGEVIQEIDYANAALATETETIIVSNVSTDTAEHKIQNFPQPLYLDLYLEG